MKTPQNKSDFNFNSNSMYKVILPAVKMFKEFNKIEAISDYRRKFYWPRYYLHGIFVRKRRQNFFLLQKMRV